MPELLLELFSEEIPARMQSRAAEDLGRLISAALAPLSPQDVRTFHGPRRLTLAAMTLANSMILVDQTAVPLAVPALISDLGGSLGEGPWILTANILPLAALMVLGGRLGDLLGLRKVFLAGAVIFVCSSAAVRSSTSREFCRRVRRSASMVSALRPDAHTMKMKPSCASYARFASARSASVCAAAFAAPACSPCDHVASPLAGVLASPIFGCAANASR